jgi:hypothetical protein
LAAVAACEAARVMLPPVNRETQVDKNGVIKSQKHHAWVRTRLCIAWERKECEGPVECCHARDIAPRGHGGGKPSSVFCVAMCRKHHRQSEKREKAWGDEFGIDVEVCCMEFAAASPDFRVKAGALAHIKVMKERARHATATKGEG